MPQTLTLPRPDDFHLHLRDGAIMKTVLPHSAARFARAVIMPNLSPPVTAPAHAMQYRDAIMQALPQNAPGNSFAPLMSLYLTDNTSRATVAEAANNEHIIGFKFYPAGATTNSDNGVTRIAKVMPVLEAMAEYGVVLQVHAEVTDSHVDVFDREAVFIEQVLAPLHREIPQLKIVLEHATTKHGVQFVREAGAGVAATITVHHLLYNRNELFRGGLRPHAYCLPVLKREEHRQALLAAATGGETAFFLGTDSAPHLRRDKESACGCAGIYSAHAALELYAQVFEQAGALQNFAAFASENGADFYGLPRNTDTVTLQKRSWRVPASYAVGEEEIVALCAGEEVGWEVVG